MYPFPVPQITVTAWVAVPPWVQASPAENRWRELAFLLLSLGPDIVHRDVTGTKLHIALGKVESSTPLLQCAE
jgi:hypothetical protein